MRHRRTLLITSMIVITVIGVYIYMLSSISNGPLHRRESPQLVSIEVWLYTQELSSFFLDYKTKNPHVNVEIRTFRSYEQLYNELTAAVSAHHAPQIAEVNSNYGIAQLAASGSLLSVGDQLPTSIWNGMNANAPDFFQYGDKRWAIPYGLSMNVLYYNEKLMTYSSLEDMTSVQNWDDLLGIDSLLAASRKVNESRTHWGLVMDRELPWYLQNIFASQEWNRSEKEKHLAQVFEFWRKLIHEQKIMPPLQHHLAMSDFIDGRAVLFLSSSEKWPVLEKYIGGRFGFGMLPIPYSYRSIPKVSGLAVLQSTTNQEKISIESIAFLLEEENQQKMWEITGQNPVGKLASEKLFEDLAGHPMQHITLQTNQLKHKPVPRLKDKEVWKLMEEIGEELELSNAQSIELLILKLISKGGDSE